MQTKLQSSDSATSSSTEGQIIEAQDPVENGLSRWGLRTSLKEKGLTTEARRMISSFLADIPEDYRAYFNDDFQNHIHNYVIELIFNLRNEQLINVIQEGKMTIEDFYNKYFKTVIDMLLKVVNSEIPVLLEKIRGRPDWHLLKFHDFKLEEGDSRPIQILIQVDKCGFSISLADTACGALASNFINKYFTQRGIQSHANFESSVEKNIAQGNLLVENNLKELMFKYKSGEQPLFDITKAIFHGDATFIEAFETLFNGLHINSMFGDRRLVYVPFSSNN